MHINTLRPRQNGPHSPDDIFKCIFLNENIWISFETSLKFVPEGPINNIPSLAEIMAWCRPGDKPLSEPMTVRLSTHICVTRPLWVTVENMVSVERRIPIHFDGQPICPDMQVTCICEFVRCNGCWWLKVIHSMCWREKQKHIIMSINSLRPSDAYIRQWNKPSLVQLMACRLYGAKPLSEAMLEYFQLDP